MAPSKLPCIFFNGEEYCPFGIAAEKAGVSRKTIYNWIAEGKIKVLVKPSGRKLVRVKDLLKEEDNIGNVR